MFPLFQTLCSRAPVSRAIEQPPRHAGISRTVGWAVALLAALLAPLIAAAAPTHELMAKFDIPPQNPGYGTLALGPDGYYWGTTQAGGAYGGVPGNGTIFKVRADGTDWQTVLSFSGTGTTNRGALPYGGLVSDGAGSLWGTTNQGGASNMGTVFKVNASTGVLTTLAEFTGASGSNKGASPWGTLVSDGAGNFWGTTEKGGSAALGTIFKVNASSGALTTVVELTGTQPAYPYAALVPDGAGYFWGTSFYGGVNGMGTIFKVNIGSGALGTVLEFSDGSPIKGKNPYGALVSDGLGNFWGTTTAGGANGYGTVFKVNAGNGALSTLVEFTSGGASNRGRLPTAGLVSDGAGSLWGTTSFGGNGDFGTVFKVNVSSGGLTTMAEFTANGATNRGSYLKAGLLNDGAGSFWGTTQFGGATGLGTVFKINIGTGALTTLVEFVSNSTSNKGFNPKAGLVSDGAGSFWATTNGGGAGGYGTIAKVNSITGALTTPVEFTGTGGGATRGSYPFATLTSDGAGYYWGTTQGGGIGSGTIFKVKGSDGTLSIVLDFTGNSGANKGANPHGDLISDGAGNLWGTTIGGGANGLGTIFKVNAGSGVLTTVIEFTGTAGANKGSNPYAGLVSDGAGNFWGTTQAGGANSYGTLFKLNVGSGALTTLVEFTNAGASNKGANPVAELVSDGAGNFWGTTQNGGTTTYGTIFKYNVSGNTLTTVLEFTRSGTSNRGAYPWSPLVSDGASALWGTTNQGGAGSVGTVFKVDVNSGMLTTLLEFTGTGTQAAAGANPGYGALLKYSDGNFYGTTVNGGPGGGGTIFRLRYGPTPVTQSASAISYTTATLNGTLNPNGNVTTASFEFGTDPALAGAAIVSAGTTTAGTALESVSAALSGLAVGTTYYFRVRGLNSDNSIVQTGAILSFTTRSNTLPTVTLAGANPMTFEAAASYTDPGATASDAEDGALTPVIISNTVVPNVPGTYTVTWRATDSMGGITTVTRTVNVVDTTAPAVTPPSNVTVAATSPSGALVNYSAATASDAIGVVSITYSKLTGTTFAIGTTTVTVTAKDAANNAGVATFTVTVTPLPALQNWRYQFFGTMANSGNAADAADPDGDGIPNLVEFATNSSPTIANGPPGQLVRNGSSLEFSYTRSKAAMGVGIIYSIEWSDDLVPVDWHTGGVTETILSQDANVQQVKATLSAGSSGLRFVRLRVSTP